MESNDDLHYITKKSKDNAISSRPKRHLKSIVKYEDCYDSDCNFTPNKAGRDKKKKSSSQSEKTSTSKSIIYQCSLCTFQIYMKSKLKRHFTICSKGLRTYPVKQKYKVTKGVKFRCEYCPFETSTLKNLLSHKQSHAKLVAAGLIECTHCNLTFFTIEECTKHMNISVDVGDPKKKPLVCLKCQRQADSQMQLVVHMALDHVEPKCLFACIKPGCGFETDHKDELKGHLMDTHKLGESLFRPLTDAYSERQQSSFRCSKCIYNTKKEVYLKAHYLTNHSKISEAPFRCPWSDCYTYLGNKKSLRRHLKVMHGMDAKDDTAVPSDQGRQPDVGSSLSCSDCDHKSRTDFQMLIHRSLCHPKSQKRFGCPVPECVFITNYKHHLRRHLREVHKLGEEHFRNYGLLRPEEQSESDEAEDVVERVDENLDEVSIVDCDYEGKCLSTGPCTKRYKCGLCLFTSNHNWTFGRHQTSVHHKRQCDICKKTVWGKYQWFWHNFSVHNRQRGSEIYRWWLRCELCSYEGTTKSSYKHGATHELPRVMFLTLYTNVASGYVTFYYAEHEEKSSGKEDNEDCVAPSAIKVLDWTRSEEKGDVFKTLQQLGTEMTITIEFADDSDVEAETRSNRGDPKVCNPPPKKKSKLLTCKECSFKTRDDALLKLHGVQMHGVGETGHARQYRCPEDNCSFQAKECNNLKRHLKNTHKYNQNLWKLATPSSTWKMKRNPQPKEEADNIRAPDEKHATEIQASTNLETDPDHHQDSKRKTQKMRSFSDKKHSQEPPKWRLKCSLCPFETLLKKSAHSHGAQHSHVPQVTFHKYEGNQRRGVIKYRNPHASTRCRNAGSRPMDSYKHEMRQHMPNVENIERREARRAKKHVGTRLVRNKTVARNATKRDDNPDLEPSKHMKDSRLNKTEQGVISVRNTEEDFVDAGAFSDGNEEEAGIENPKNRPDIETEVIYTTIDSDWICALENDILGDDNEIIRIEVIDEKLVEAVPKAKAATLRIKCKNKGCDDYVCHDTDDIQNHAESCAKSLSRQSQSPEEFVCTMCKTPFPDKETLQNHILYEHLINQEAKPMPKTKLIVKRQRASKKIPGRVSFKCSMCGMSIVNVKSLRRHTYVHAREEDNFDMKVRYSKYKGNTRVATVVIKADPAYVPKSSSNVPVHDVPTARVPSPMLEYDSELPVFACAECNFKTNKEPELTRHKNLHWSKEKAAAFNSQKWFTCGMCYFHCLDAATFKEHAYKHKSHHDT